MLSHEESPWYRGSGIYALVYNPTNYNLSKKSLPDTETPVYSPSMQPYKLQCCYMKSLHDSETPVYSPSIQPYKLQCCHMKSLHDTETLVYAP